MRIQINRSRTIVPSLLLLVVLTAVAALSGAGASAPDSAEAVLPLPVSAAPLEMRDGYERGRGRVARGSHASTRRWLRARKPTCEVWRFA